MKKPRAKKQLQLSTTTVRVLAADRLQDVTGGYGQPPPRTHHCELLTEQAC